MTTIPCPERHDATTIGFDRPAVSSLVFTLLLLGTAGLLLGTAGCEDPYGDSASSNPTTPSAVGQSNETNRSVSGLQVDNELAIQVNPDGSIVSEGPIVVRNGRISSGPPKVDEQVQREIYKSLTFRRKMQANSTPRGSQQMQDEYQLILKSFMSRYNLSQQDIDAILRKGEQENWK